MDHQAEKQKPELAPSEVGHIDTAAPEHTPKYILLPGDPNRIRRMTSQWDAGASEYVLSRQMRAAVGTYKGVEIGAWSTGIGAPSTETVLVDLCEKGSDTFIRVGTTGAIQEEIRIGDIIINDAHVRLDGTTKMYVMEEYPAGNSYEVVLALIEACERLGLRYHVGTGCTCPSFYTGQARTLFNGYRPTYLDGFYADLRQAGVLNFEMEGSCVSTLARLMGKRAAMCASVVAQRITGEWDETEEGENNACLAGAEALRILAQWDELKKEKGKKFYFPGIEKK